jgi:1-acyl-sn-glycerol-3-phosphate acyltransferase
MIPIVYRIANVITRWVLMPLYGSYSVSGAENVPLAGPLVVASNHLNDADPGALAWGIPRPLRFMAKVELFRIPVLRQFLLAYGAFPVRRGEADLSALRTAGEVVKAGEAIVIFPEGTRSGARAALGEALTGAALVALRNDVPVLPCAVTGSQHMAMPKMFLKVYRPWNVHLTIGEPFRLPKPTRLNADAAREGTRIIMEHIAALLPPEYRGYYEYVGEHSRTAAASTEDE